MFYDSLAFQAMRSSLNGLAIEQNIILHNLANYETPGYKENYVQTLYLYQKISGQFTNMNYILEQSAK